MTKHSSYLAVDAGQGAHLLRLVTPDGVINGSRPGILATEPLPPQWLEAVASFLAEHPTANPTAIAIGASGLTKITPKQLELLHGPGIRTVVVAHDSVADYLGALGNRTGCVISAGTGTICMAMGSNAVARVDGWGHLIGDAGSRYWIGRSALEAAMRGYDGRRQLTALTDMVADDFDDLEEAYMELQADPNRVARIAAYASLVDNLAATDRVAANILDKAAAHLSEAVQAAIRRVGLAGTRCPRVVALGDVFKSQRVLTRFADYLTLQWPNFALTEPRGDALEGAAQMLVLPKKHPLAGRLTVSEK